MSCACGEPKAEGHHAEAVCTVGAFVHLRPEDYLTEGPDHAPYSDAYTEAEGLHLNPSLDMP